VAALATVSDVEARLGRALTADEQDRLEAILDDVSAVIRSYTGQQFDRAETTDRLKVRGGKVTLPQLPVVAVDTVVNMDGNAVAHRWYAGATVELLLSVPDEWAWEPYRITPSWVDVTYTHGYDEVPADIVAVVCQVALRAFGTDATAAGVVQESIDDYSYRVGTIAASGPAGLMADERAVLNRYLAPQASVSTW